MKNKLELRVEATKEFGRFARAHRKSRGLTLETVSGLSNLSPRFLSEFEWERNGRDRQGVESVAHLGARGHRSATRSAVTPEDTLNVWNDGRLVGRLWRQRVGLIGFAYDRPWVDEGGIPDLPQASLDARALLA